MLQRAIDGFKFRRAIRAVVQSSTTLGGERDVVVMPCWRRPEMLWHCLDNLSQAAGIERLHVIFRPDAGFDPDNLAVIESFASRLGSYEVAPAVTCPYRRTKLSANILYGYMQAAARARRLVYLIEEDIMVGRDFFRWHEAVHAQREDLFCSIAVRNHNRDVDIPDDPEGYYLSEGDYCSWGVCFNRAVIGAFIARHVQPAYLAHPKRYIRRQFQGSRVGLGYVEQAGLIRRVQERSGLPIAYPTLPRAFHAGFYGNNRPGGLAGVLDDRVRQLSRVIYDHTAMRGVALSENYARDSEPVCLDTGLCNPLHEVSVAPAA